MSADKRSPDDSISAPPRASLIGLLFDFPRAIYDHGTEHGRNIRDAANRRENCREGSWHTGGKSSQWDALKKKSDAENDEVDWYKWTRRELERGEQRAKEMYDTWNPNPTQQEQSNEAPSKGTSDSDKILDDVEFVASAFARLLSEVDQFARPMFEETANVAEFAAEDPYSPINLEVNHGFDKSFRARFEDLIRADQGTKMLSQKETEHSMNQNPWDWVGRFLPQSPSDRSVEFKMCPEHRRAEQEQPKETTSDMQQGSHDEAFETEEDAFEHFLSVKEKSTQQDQWKVLSSAFQYTRHEDGSFSAVETHTKTYADGTCEVTESAERLPAKAEACISSIRPDSNDDSRITQKVETRKRGSGWFWSS